VTGKASVNNLLSEFPQPVRITAVSNADAGKMISALTNPVTGLYSFRLPQGGYSISFDSDDALSLTRKIELMPGHSGDTVRVQPVTLGETDFSAYLRLVSDTLIKVGTPDPVSIDLIAEERSMLGVEVLSPDSVITSLQYRITDTTFTFTFSPEEGLSRVSLSLTDRFGNDTGAVVSVRRNDVSARAVKPLYHKIPVRPAGDRSSEAAVDGRTVDAGAAAASVAGMASGADADTEAGTGPDAGTGEETAASGDIVADTVQAGEIDEKGNCRYWWLLAVAALLILFLLWRRKKKSKNAEK